MRARVAGIRRSQPDDAEMIPPDMSKDKSFGEAGLNLFVDPDDIVWAVLEIEGHEGRGVGQGPDVLPALEAAFKDLLPALTNLEFLTGALLRLPAKKDLPPLPFEVRDDQRQ